MQLHTPILSAPTHPRLGYLAALAAATVATAGAVIVGDDQSTPQIRAIAEFQPAATRYFDIEANKAAGIRALSSHLADTRAIAIPPYDDIAANKARSQASR